MRSVLIVCFAGGEVGLGHLSRARRLHSHLSGKNIQSRLIVVCLTELPIEPTSNTLLVKFFDFQLSDYVNLGSAQRLALVLDVKENIIPESFFRSVSNFRSRGGVVLGVDVSVKNQHYFDHIIFATCYLPIAKQNSIYVSYSFGWDCYFVDPVMEGPSAKRNNEILILTGGSDAYGVTEVLQLGLRDTFDSEKVVLNWVVGPNSTSPSRWNFEKDIVTSGSMDLSSNMESAKIAFSVFGVTVFELLSHRVPVVVYCPEDSPDYEIAKFIHEAGVIVLSEDIDTCAEDLATLLVDEEKIRNMKDKIKKLLSKSAVEKVENYLVACAR